MIRKKTGKSRSFKAGKAMSRERLWLYRLAAIVFMPLLLLLFSEAMLRIAGAGYRTETAVQFQLNGRPYYGHNLQFGWRFFPQHIARDFNGFAFEARKPLGTYRIFVLGESAAMGMPEPAYSFGRILETMLQAQYPDTKFEVINAAMVAINSHTIRCIAKDCARYEPDLFILYMGNNEVVGPFGPGSAFSPMVSNLGLIRANIALKSTRVGQMLERAGGLVAHAKNTQRWGGLEMFLDHPVRGDDAAMPVVYNHFERNLRDICSICTASGAKLLVSTVGVNLRDCAPFGSAHRRGLTDEDRQTWEEYYTEGLAQENDGNFEAALKHYQSAASIDDTFAELQFRMGRCFDRLSQLERSPACYENAMQNDVLRLRADGAINRIIHAAAQGRANEGIFFADGAGALARESRDGICGEEMFYEHVHLTFTGNYVLAKEMMTVMQSMGVSGGGQDKPILSEQECARRLVYTEFEHWDSLNQLHTKMMSEPPFTNQPYHAETMAHTLKQIETLNATMKQHLDELANLYETTLSQQSEDWMLHWRYAAFLMKGKKNAKLQEEHLRKVLPFRYVPAYLQLGQLLGSQGRFTEAKTVLEEMLALKPNAAQAHIELSRLYQLRRDNKMFIRHLSKAIALAPAISIEPYGALAEAYEKENQPDKAIKTLQRAIEVFPPEKASQAHATLGYLFCEQGEFDKALGELQIALELNPAFADDTLFQNLLRQAKAERE